MCAPSAPFHAHEQRAMQECMDARSGERTLCVNSRDARLGRSSARSGIWLVGESQDLGGLQGLPALVRPERLLQALSAGRLARPVILDPRSRLRFPVLLQQSLQHERCTKGPLQPSAFLVSTCAEAVSFTKLTSHVHERLWQDPLSCALAQRMQDSNLATIIFKQRTCELPLPSAEA